MPAVKERKEQRSTLQALLSLQQQHCRFMPLNIFQIYTQNFSEFWLASVHWNACAVKSLVNAVYENWAQNC